MNTKNNNKRILTYRNSKKNRKRVNYYALVAFIGVCVFFFTVNQIHFLHHGRRDGTVHVPVTRNDNAIHCPLLKIHDDGTSRMIHHNHPHETRSITNKTNMTAMTAMTTIPSADTIKSLLIKERKCMMDRYNGHRDIKVHDLSLTYELTYAFIQAFQMNQISIFLAFGSHIGARRHHGIIPFKEKDVDFAIFSLDVQQVQSIVEEVLHSRPQWENITVNGVDFGIQVRTNLDHYFDFWMFSDHQHDHQHDNDGHNGIIANVTGIGGDKVTCIGRKKAMQRQGERTWSNGCERWFSVVHNMTPPVFHKDDFFPPFYQMFGSHKVPIPAKSSEIESLQYMDVPPTDINDQSQDHWNISCGWHRNWMKKYKDRPEPHHWVYRPFRLRDCSKKYNQYPFVFLKDGGRVEQLRIGAVVLHETIHTNVGV